MNSASTRLYLISPERLEHPSIFADELRAALDGGDVAAFQLRLKNVDDAAIVRAADTLRPICQQRGVAFFMNDRPDLAVKLDCDGVHVGQDDMPCAEARRIVGPDRQVGVTAKASRHLAMEAAEAGADYVAFGAFFLSGTKVVTTPADLEILEWWSGLMEVPFVMGWPGKQAVLPSLSPGGANAVPKIHNVELLGQKGKLKYTQDEAGLKVDLPEQKPSDYAVTLKLALA